MPPACRPRSIIPPTAACWSTACVSSLASCSVPKDWSKTASPMCSRPAVLGYAGPDRWPKPCTGNYDAKSRGGIVTRYQILEHPTEHGQAVEAVAHHQALFEHPPNLVAGDRGVHSADTEERLTAAGVKRVAIPAAGKLSEERQALERTRSWKRGYRWRAGIEGRIASLRRDYGSRTSRYHGLDGLERWLGLGVIASNLRRIALAK